MVKTLYENVICIGTGQLVYDCAQIAKQYNLSPLVIEYKITDKSALQKKCLAYNIDYICMDKEGLTKKLKGIEKKSLIVSAASTYIMPDEILKKKNLTIINWHNSLLPAHKGRNAECWCIFEGDKETGITWHEITSVIDGGDIYCQESFPLTSDDTALGVFHKQCELGKITFAKICKDILLGRMKIAKQEKTEGETFHYAKDRPADGILDINKDFDYISRFLRAYDYGALHLLGEIKTYIAGKYYSFMRYKIKEMTLDSVDEGFIGEKYVFCKDRKVIELLNIKVIGEKNER